MPYIEGKPWTWFGKGNVVLWTGDLYVVSKVHDDHLELIPFKYEKSTSSPSETWPYKEIYHCPDENYDEPLEEGEERTEPCGYCLKCEGGYPHYDKVPDKTKTVETVKKVADNIEQYLMRKMKSVIFSEAYGTWE